MALKKTLCRSCGCLHRGWYDRTVRRARDLSCGDTRIYFVEGLNTKIRVIQRCAYGLRDEEYLRLKILTCMLPEL
jgi:transposase